MADIQFNDSGFAKLTGIVHLYHVASDSGEFLFESDEWVSVGVGIPAYSYIEAPLVSQPGFAVCRINGNWEYVEDHRGVEAYSTQTQELVEIMVLGPLPADVTTLRPATLFDRWNGERWVTDEAVKRQAEIDAAARQKRDLVQKANAAIETLNDAIELGMAEPGDEDMLKAWRAYRVKLSRIDVQSETDVAWPVLPTE